VADGRVRFTTPATLRLGAYLIGVSTADSAQPREWVEVQVTRDPSVRPVLRSVDPATGFPGPNGTYDLVLLGEGFSEVPEDNVLVFDGRDEIEAVWSDQAARSAKSSPVHGTFFSTHKLRFEGIPARYWGAEKVALRIGDTYSDPPLPVDLSRFAAWVPLFGSLVVTGLLAALVLYAASRGLTRARVGDTVHNLVTTLLLDAETDSLSLAKFQLYSWTSASVFAYVYMLLVRSLIQGRFDFPAVPENLPGLLAVSLTTSGTAKGISSVRGPKGAGAIQPCLSDFITFGGVVSAERFQFFVWTVLGVLSFLFLIVVQSPAQFRQVPRIPESFLALMGVSSAGYLGGKLARKPGPVIDQIMAQSGAGRLTLVVVGRCLSKNAGFLIGDGQVTVKLIDPTVQVQPAAAGAADITRDAQLQVIRKDDRSSDPAEYAAELRLTLTDPGGWATRHGRPADYLNPPAAPREKPTLTVVNPDGQMAVWTFEVQPAAGAAGQAVPPAVV
jgi:hypothetical protein